MARDANRSRDGSLRFLPRGRTFRGTARRIPFTTLLITTVLVISAVHGLLGKPLDPAQLARWGFGLGDLLRGDLWRLISAPTLILKPYMALTISAIILFFVGTAELVMHTRRTMIVFGVCHVVGYVGAMLLLDLLGRLGMASGGGAGGAAGRGRVQRGLRGGGRAAAVPAAVAAQRGPGGVRLLPAGGHRRGEPALGRAAHHRLHRRRGPGHPVPSARCAARPGPGRADQPAAPGAAAADGLDGGRHGPGQRAGAPAAAPPRGLRPAGGAVAPGRGPGAAPPAALFWPGAAAAGRGPGPGPAQRLVGCLPGDAADPVRPARGGHHQDRGPVRPALPGAAGVVEGRLPGRGEGRLGRGPPSRPAPRWWRPRRWSPGWRCWRCGPSSPPGPAPWPRARTCCGASCSCRRRRWPPPPAPRCGWWTWPRRCSGPRC